MKPWITNSLVVAGACAVMLGGIELALRTFGDDVLAMGNQFAFFRFDDRLGWNNLAGARGYFARSEYRIDVSINSLSMRDREPLPADAPLQRVAVLGDSFVWGVGAEYGERFTEVLEADAPQLDVWNYGVSGFGTTQEYLQLDTVLARKPDYVVVAFCLSNDVMETVYPFRTGYNKPFAKRGDDGRVEVSGYPLLNTKAMGKTLVGADSNIRLIAVLDLLLNRLRKPDPALGSPRFKTAFTIEDSKLYTADDRLSDEERKQKTAALDIDADLIAMMQQKVERVLGVGRFVLAFVPTKAELPSSTHVSNEVGDQLLKRLHARGVAVLDTRAQFNADDFWKRDGHWNAQGHQTFARALKAYLAGKLPAPHPN